VFEDWLFHFLLPLVSYALLTMSAISVSFHEHEALFGVGSAAMLLLFIGIHNTWDSVAYHIFVNTQDPNIEQHRKQRRDQNSEKLSSKS
jgi:hypothetical protein